MQRMQSSVLETIDALMAAPDQAAHWRRLYQLLLDQPSWREAALLRLRELPPLAGDAAFLLANFWMHTWGGWDALVQARRVLDDCVRAQAEKVCLLAMQLPAELLHVSTSHREAESRLREARWVDLGREQAMKVLAGLKSSVRGKAAEGPVRRVAIASSVLGPHYHPQTRLVHAHARLLSSLGIEVAVFSPLESHGRAILDQSGGDTVRGLDPHDPAHWKDAGLALWSADPEKLLVERWRGLLSAVETFCPDAVLYVGLHSTTQELLAAHHAIAVLPVIGLAPIGTADVWLSSRPHAASPGDAGPQSVLYRYRHDPPGELDRIPALPRHELGADGKTLLLVSVGARLRQEIVGDWAREMCELLQARPRARWVLVGGGMPAALQPVAAQVDVRPPMPEKELVALLKACDLAVNPPRLGGGLSIALATACGLPVVSLAGCDGGDKLGDDAVADQQTYFRVMEDLLASKELRRETGRRMQARHDSEIALRAAGPALVQALGLAQARATSRLDVRLNGPVSVPVS
jgi:glycosyltransferase involved in cell wall biosynthesis